MNKDKLIQIIVKDLEELKTFTEEVAKSQDNSTLIVDLALSRTQLIGKEFEILRQFLLQAGNLNEEPEVDSTNVEEEEDDSDRSFSDPELEIINFEEPESDQDEVEEEEPVLYNSDEDELEEEDFDDTEEDIDEDDLTSEDEIEVELEVADPDETDDLEEEDPDELDDLDDDFDDEDEDELEEEDEDELVAFEEKDIPQSTVQNEKEEKAAPQPKSNVYMNELKFESQPGVREIHIEDMDDEVEEPVRFSPQAGTTQRPVMHEIPKPEFTAPEKVVIAETFQKDRSLNDTIAENKSEESSLGNGPITSLKASIGLNDRFLFIREIFANNTDKYNMVIDQLDKLETIQQAVEFLKAQLTLQKNETSLKFVELLKRRFSK